MEYCIDCGGKLTSNAKFCHKCGSSTLICSNTEQTHITSSKLAITTLQKKDKGVMLEDHIGKIFSDWAFQVQKRITLVDDAGATHEIDVFASKEEPFGKVMVAIECKNVSSKIGIEDLRNFQVKLTRLKISKGIFVSTGGFTTGAKEFAKSAGIELWDDAKVWKKSKKSKTTQMIDNAVHPKIQDPMKIHLPTIHNAIKYLKINLEKTHLIYRPIHIFEYSCSSQKSAKGSSYDITSRGIVAMNDSTLRLVESTTESGINPSVDNICSVLNDWQKNKLETLQINDNNIIEETRLAPRTAKKEVKKRLAECIECKIEVVEARRTARVGRIPYNYDVKGTRVLKPRQRDIEIIDQSRVYYPFWSVNYSYLGREIKRVIDAVTGNILEDTRLICEKCNWQVSAFCLKCGAPLCKKHLTTCTICKKIFCSRENCTTKIGRILKKTYCTSCLEKERSES